MEVENETTIDGIDIDAVDIERDELMVRGRNLTHLVGKVSYVSAIYHIITGNLPCKKKEAALSEFMVRCAKEAFSHPSHYEQIQNFAKSGCEIESLVMMAILLFEPVVKEKVCTLLPVDLCELESAAEGLFLMAIIPSVIYYSLPDKEHNDLYKFGSDMCALYHKDFIALTLALMTGNKSQCPESLMLLDALMVSLHAGFGIITPTIVLSRFSASTRASIAKNIVAGFTGSGAMHVGACKAAMALFKKLSESGNQYDINNIKTIFCNTKPIPGFGHPILNLDPRNEMLSSLVSKSKKSHEYFTAYQSVVEWVAINYNIQPNIDLIAAAIMLDLGFNESLGTVVFLFARVPTMIAHSIEKKKAPPFGINKVDARKHFSVLPKRWI